MQAVQASGDGQLVTFAVTLPGASANSLVVTQPNSQSVHQQVAGWFTTQMASRGAPRPRAVCWDSRPNGGRCDCSAGSCSCCTGSS